MDSEQTDWSSTYTTQATTEQYDTSTHFQQQRDDHATIVRMTDGVVFNQVNKGICICNDIYGVPGRAVQMRIAMRVRLCVREIGDNCLDKLTGRLQSLSECLLASVFQFAFWFAIGNNSFDFGELLCQFHWIPIASILTIANDFFGLLFSVLCQVP